MKALWTEGAWALKKKKRQAPPLQESESVRFSLPLGSYVNCFYLSGCETERDTQNVLTL